MLPLELLVYIVSLLPTLREKLKLRYVSRRLRARLRVVSYRWHTIFIGFLNRNLRACSKPLKELSYKQFVLPILDYASSVWDPYHQGNINKLEMIQHRGARFVLNQPWQRNVRDSVSLLLQSLNWPTLQIRREQGRSSKIISDQAMNEIAGGLGG